MNVIELMNEAWEDRCNLSHEQNEISFKNLLSHGYVAMEKAYNSTVKDYGDTLFYCIQRILVWLMLADGDFLQGEYDAYLKYCKWANFQPLTVDDCYALFNRMTRDDIMSCINHVTATRGHIDESDYRAFVRSLCFMSLFGDKELDKGEYTLISFFFNRSSDYSPDWETFKREW